MANKRRKPQKRAPLVTILVFVLIVAGYLLSEALRKPEPRTTAERAQTPPAETVEAAEPTEPTESAAEQEAFYTLDTIPDYSGTPYIELNGNEPGFTDDDLTTNSFESYSELDELGRCGTAYACVGQDLMPTEERGNISRVKPTGWVQNQYDFVNGKSLYNRCHLIAYQLTGENANWQNLITGTRSMNEEMIPFENQVADYVKETDNHVLYRVTPIFEGDELVARGVQMEALSVEDGGDGISFNVYLYNVEDGVVIDYATGENYAA